MLGPAPTYLADQAVIGHWLAKHSSGVARILYGYGKKSMKSLAESVNAKAVKLETGTHNVNTPEDLDRVSSLVSEHEYGV